MKDEAALLLAIYVIALCIWGIYAKVYRENWLQWAGIAVVVGSCVAIGYRAVVDERVGSRTVGLLAGVALYATGVALKVWQTRRLVTKPQG